MQQALEFLLRHIELVVFGTVLAEQIGVPVPAIPILLGAGAVAATGQTSLALLTGLSVAGCLLGDMVWYELGRHRGRQALNLFCACPNEATAAKMALMLKRRGISRVRPLLGGIDGWRELAYPLELVVSQKGHIVTARIST